MRVRPFFWCFLALTCIGALTFAATRPTHAPATMQVHVDSSFPASTGYTTLELHLSDFQDIPIEQAQVIPQAHMTNMPMESDAISVRALGQGNYRVQLHLYMAGPWEIKIVAQADGFDALQRTLLVQV